MQIECGHPGNPRKLFEEGVLIPIQICGERLHARIDLLVHYGFIGENVARRLNLEPSDSQERDDGSISRLYLIDVVIGAETSQLERKLWFIEDKDERFTSQFGDILYVGRQFLESFTLEYNGETGSVLLWAE